MSYTDSIGCLFNCASKFSILKRKMTCCHPALLLDEIPNLQRTILIANDIWLKNIFLFCLCKLCSASIYHLMTERLWLEVATNSSWQRGRTEDGMKRFST